MFESYLILAVGGIETLQHQMEGQTEAWCEARAQLSSQGVAVKRIGDMLDHLVEEMHYLHIKADCMTESIDSQTEGTRGGGVRGAVW